MTRPTLDPSWATDTNYTGGPDVGTAVKVVPGSGLRSQGWDPNDRPGAQHLNAMLNAHGAWFNYLKDIDWLNFTPIEPGWPGGPAVSLAVKPAQSFPTAGPFFAIMTKALGGDNHVARSNDGMNFELTDAGILNFDPSLHPRSIIWSPVAALWIACAAVGSTVKIVTSPDTHTWTTRTDPATDAARNVIADNGSNMIVIGRGATGFLSSPTGATWTERTNPTTEKDTRALAWGNSKFVALMNGGEAAHSADGITWTASGTTLFHVTDMAFDPVHGVFIAVGGYSGGDPDKLGFASSADGITWTDHSITSPISWVTRDTVRSVTIDPSGVVYASSDRCLLRSLDGGVTWEAQPMTGLVAGVAIASGRLIAFGSNAAADDMRLLLGVRTSVQ